MQEKALNWLDRLTKSARLTPKRILRIYTFVLFFAPLAYLLSLTYLIASLFVICFVFYVVLAFRAVKG
ncbi:hypothetical protein LDE04_11220 [Lactobacillus delbrueckii subsp. lactis]|jgi:uncharacterized membrane protein HdeD (DUF308 family)|nr:hypothetical protein LL717_00360 [Lactobacillus delbrueckii subsp. lactis]ASW64458.1 hypothetical protein LDL34_09000 [Lactobacillus delbrueckii subsp. lactis]OOV05202.1 hypothetical protein LL034_11345 [Lactobacillus delbrueckii subsp. lactis]GEA78942.1 hypothetical protein LDE04_11220 [Lactobacillus delbrueckii subsp. lactis]